MVKLFEILTDKRFIWGVVPDFWSISGSGLILGGTIWVAIAQSRTKQERSDDLESGYVVLNSEEKDEKENYIEIEKSCNREDEQSDSSSSPPYSPSLEKLIGDIFAEEKDMNIERNGGQDELI